MVKVIQVNESLSVEIGAGADPVIRIARVQGGLVAIRGGEVRHLVAALVEAGGELAEGEAARIEALTAAGRMGRQVVEARRARRKRMGADND